MHERHGRVGTVMARIFPFQYLAIAFPGAKPVSTFAGNA
ncbi:Hypothetical protein, conserved [Brucella abortus str. 2308 A]|nr:conserved hypothetical protein [Brucella melitensis M28]ADZ87622.1 conserved hypothetical protein [Brucella melitensis M5-90]AEW17164.1 hypothetical protein BAA13334_I01290 [Brucella abortus A13334]AIJ64486.1 hypothetical protein DO74_237 [Brucella abortus bv. 6 str. 870]AIK03686.1 hypothetical protein DK54_992 [Brucella abortus]EEP62939.1 Hypothetical protein, conserved [Brucella abortus str. 2308 A]EXU83963.1 hypothetical protein AX23_02420 [Brucella melitensis 548]